jgi:hypothetical protein
MNMAHSKIVGSGDDKLNWLEVVRRQVDSLKFGAVEIVVHDSRVVQIETTERLRLGTAESAPPRPASPVGRIEPNRTATEPKVRSPQV